MNFVVARPFSYMQNDYFVWLCKQESGVGRLQLAREVRFYLRADVQEEILSERYEI